MTDVVEYVYLDPTTLEPLEGGQKFRKITRDSGSVILEMANDLPPSLDILKSDKLAELQAARDAEIYSSFTSMALDGATPKTYNSDEIAFANMEQKELQLLADTTIASVTWYNKEDGFVTHTRDQFLQLVKENAARIDSCKMKYFQLEPTVNAATDEAAVDAVTW